MVTTTTGNQKVAAPTTTSSSQHIKGGGRALMSSESRQAVISLLQQLANNNNDKYTNRRATKDPLSVSSKHGKEQEEKRFVQRLVRTYEQRRLAKQYNNNSDVNVAVGGAIADGDGAGAGGGAGNDDKRKGTASSMIRGSNNNTNNNPSSAIPAPNTTTTGNVRIELAEASFQEQNQVPTTSIKKNVKQHDPPFRVGTKKVMVLPRSTTIASLCQQAKSKLRAKSKMTRAFVVPETTMTSAEDPLVLFELQTDLSGVTDGTIVYVTSTPKATRKAALSTTRTETRTTGGSHDTENNSGDDDDLNDRHDCISIDPLDQVKQAYAQRARQQQHHHHHRHQSSPNENSIAINASNTMDASQQRRTMILDSKRAQLASVRQSLPAWACKSEILDASKNHTVVILSGATGSGKSTQVPQFLFEEKDQIVNDNPNNDTSTSQTHPYIVVTQPRRVAAISLAHRVAEELGSPPPGDKGSLVGYIVRLDRRVADASCRIIYCTIGVLLRMLVCPKEVKTDSDDTTDDRNNDSSPPQLPPLSLDTISHLILDEVHERDVNTDFSLTLLKGLLASKQYPNLRLLLMSATASANFFTRYFASVTKTPPASLEIPGRSFPVRIHWLSDCETLTGTKLWHGGGAHQNDFVDQQQRPSGSSEPMLLSPRVYQKIDNNLICALIGKIVQQQQSDGELQVSSSGSSKKLFRDTGAILVFLPGKAEIEALARRLYEDRATVGNRDLCKILKLHSTMPRSEQQSVFHPVLMGTIKIVLATNVAETSVTIPDISHVIDTGRVKESRFNPSTRIKELVTVWTSQASATQRSGRAGRTSAGICWRLYSEDFYETHMLLHTTPEMVRTPLDELILQICLLFEQRLDEHNFTTAKSQVVPTKGHDKHTTTTTTNSSNFPLGVRPIKFLSKAPSPPPDPSLLEACRHLLEVDALRVVVDYNSSDDKEQGELSRMYRLTPLGYHLSRLPMDAKVGKVLIVGCILGCLDGALTVAAALSCTNSCFLSLAKSHPTTPSIIQARESLVENGFGGPTWPGGTVKGDLIAVIAIFRAWKKKLQHSENACWEFCKRYGLGIMTLKEMDQLRTQFLELLGDAGFVPRNVVNNNLNNRHQNQEEDTMEDDCNDASEDALLTSCCLIGGLYPNVCTLMRPRKGGPRGGRLLTKEGDICRSHCNSFQRNRIQSAAEVGGDAYAVFHAKQTFVNTTSNRITSNNNSGVADGKPQRSADVFLTEVNFISRFALLLFGGELQIAKNNAIIVDGWLKFKVASSTSSGKDKINEDKNKEMENAVLILSLREAVDNVILGHVIASNASPKAKQIIMEQHKAVKQVVRKLLSEEG